MKITKRQLRRIIREEKTKLLEQPEQMSFNEPAIKETDELIRMLDEIYKRYQKLTFEFPDTVPDQKVDQVELSLFDAAEELRTIKFKMQDARIK